jgi:hypothetical protein
LQYATTSELADFLASGVVVEDGDRLLKRASDLVDFTVRSAYETDAQLYPIDEAVSDALRDAVCAQVEQWLEVGESNDVDGLERTQVGVGGFSGLRAPALAPRAYRLLANANLLKISEFEISERYLL